MKRPHAGYRCSLRRVCRINISRHRDMSKEFVDALIRYDDLSPAERAAFHASMASDPERVRFFVYWRRLEHEVGTRFIAELPDRDVLVLYALSLQDPEVLSLAERRRVDEARAVIEATVERSPAMRDVIEQVRSAREDFLREWDRHIAEKGPRRSVRESGIFRLYRVHRPSVMRLAASFLILVLSSLAVFFVWRSQHVEVIRSGPGEYRVVKLVDGSTVRLYGKSKITYRKPASGVPFGRSLYLTGRAFFDVTPDPTPFTVETPTALTRAIGTRFGIDASRRFTEVVLAQGMVEVDSRRNRGHVVTLAPGEYSRITRSDPPTPPQRVENLTEMLGWTGLAVFRHTPLEDVAAYFSRHFGVDIDVSPELAREPFNASFDPDTLDVRELLDALSEAFGAAYTKTDQGYLLR